MDEELVAQLEVPEALGDLVLLKAAIAEIKRLDSVVKYHETRAHYEMYGRRSSALHSG